MIDAELAQVPIEDYISSIAADPFPGFQMNISGHRLGRAQVWRRRRAAVSPLLVGLVPCTFPPPSQITLVAHDSSGSEATATGEKSKSAGSTSDPEEPNDDHGPFGRAQRHVVAFVFSPGVAPVKLRQWVTAACSISS